MHGSRAENAQLLRLAELSLKHLVLASFLFSGRFVIDLGWSRDL